MGHGAYLLLTNCPERDPAQLWKWYVQLTQAEAAFRTAKSDLGLRQVYHQLACRGEERIEMRVRTVARPAPRVEELLQHLGLRLPVRNRVMEGVPGPD